MSFLSFLHELGRTGERRLCILRGEIAWQYQQVKQYLDPSDKTVLWLTPDVLQQTSLTVHAQKMLGHTFNFIVYDFQCGVNPDILGLVSGTLKGGGLFFFLAPQTTRWADSIDYDQHRFIDKTNDFSQCHNFFIQRMQHLLQQDSSVIWVSQNQTPSWDHSDLQKKITWSLHEDKQGCLSHEQHQAVECAYQLAQKKNSGHLLMTADRGRGKSATMGIAARLIHNNQPTYTMAITAPRLATTQTFFSFAPASIHFIATDRLLHEDIKLDLLWIDEAAAIPIPMLNALFERYPKIVFATTEHGYEGSGKSFTLRFKKALLHKYPKSTIIKLNTPIRWASFDRLEHLFYQLLLINTNPLPLKKVNSEKLTYREIKKLDYAVNENKLREIFSLLCLAHYQTKPSDLRALLDKKNQLIWVAEHQQQVVGVVWVQIEGEVDCDAHSIWAGRRRLRGHLLPQSISTHLGFEEAVKFRFARIMRIVVHPQLQQKTIGSQLLQHVQYTCQQRHCHFIGAMFAADPHLIKFWRKNNYQCLRLGVKADHCSGQHSALMLQALQKQQMETLDHWQQRFCTQWLDMFPGIFKQLEPKLIQSLLPDFIDQVTYQDMDCLDILGFIRHHRGFEYTRPALKRWMATHCFLWKEAASPLPEVLIACCWQCRTLSDVCAHYQFLGRKQLLQFMKNALSHFNFAISGTTVNK